MQPVQLFIFAGRGFKDAFENTQERKINRTNAISVIKQQAGNLRRHFKAQSVEKSIKCNQCKFESSWADFLRTHTKSTKQI